MPIDYEKLYNSRFFIVERRFVGSGERRWPYDGIEARTFLSILYRYKNINDFLNNYSAYKKDFKKWNLLDLSKSALTTVLFESIALNRACDEPLLSCFDWEILVNFMLNSFISDGILRFVKDSDLQSMSSKELILKGSLHSIDNILSFDKQLFNKKGLKNLLLFLKIDIISANYIVDKTFKTKDLTLVKSFILNLISFQNTKSSFLLTKVIEDFNVFFTDTSFDKETFNEISKKLLENQYAELENFDVINVFESGEGEKSKASEIFVNNFMIDVYKELLKQNEGENETKKILKSFESYLLSYDKNILLLEAPEIEKYILSFTLDREFEISSLIQQKKPFYDEILRKMSFTRLLLAIIFQTLVAARAFGFAGPLPASYRGTDGAFTTVVQSISNKTGRPVNENLQVVRATPKVKVIASPSTAQNVQLVQMPSPFDAYYFNQQGRSISSNSSKTEITSKAVKQPNLKKNALEKKVAKAKEAAAEKALIIKAKEDLAKAKTVATVAKAPAGKVLMIEAKQLTRAEEVAAEQALIIKKDINKKVKKGNRRGTFDVVINGTIVYTDIKEPIFLANYLNTSMPYGQRQGIMKDLKETLKTVPISRSELGLIESNAIVDTLIIPNSTEVIIPSRQSKAIIPSRQSKLIIPSRQSPPKIEQEHISIEPLRKGFLISEDQGSSFAMIEGHHRAHTRLMTWLLPSEFGYTSDKLDAIAWYADYLKPLYIENLRTFYDMYPEEVHLLNMCGTNVEGVILGASAAFDAEIEILKNRGIEKKFLLPCSHVRLSAGQASIEFENFGDKTIGAGHSIQRSTEILEDGIGKVLTVLELCDCVDKQLIPGTTARAETQKLRQRLIDGVSRAIVFTRELSTDIDQTLLDKVENIMANRTSASGRELTLERAEDLARQLHLGNVKEGVERIWPKETFRFVKK